MLNLPGTAEVNSRIPKQKLYENINLSPALKRVFVENIKAVYWRYKIAPSTMNIEAGKNVTEIELFEIQLTDNSPIDGALQQINKAIPYNNIFLLSFNGKYKACIIYKTADGKLTKQINTDWLEYDNLPLQVKGFNLDSVWENFVFQISDLIPDATKTLDEILTESDEQEKIQKEIDRLEKAARRESQPNKKLELHNKIKELKKELNINSET